jgi:hypothetical protein
LVLYSGDMPAEPQNDLDQVKFVKPPVRRVELTVFFTASGAVQASHVASLSQVWKDTYPKVTERPPTPPDDDPSDQVSVLNQTSHWPIPFTTYSSAVERRSVAFQQDRFQVRWDFDEETGTPYPGFDSLLRTMRNEFEVFSGTLRENDLTLDVESSECRYVNHIAGVTAAELAVGVLTGWQGSAAPRVSDSGYVGIRLHEFTATGEDAKHDCSSLVAVDAKEDGSPSLSIIVTHNGGQNELGGIVHAHAALIETFLKHTSDEQHRMWGRK